MFMDVSRKSQLYFFPFSDVLTSHIFDATVNGIVFFVSFSDVSMLAYINTTDFCILILYPATSMNLFIGSNSF